MRKYWYYTYATANSVGDAVCWSNSGEFDLYEKIQYITNKYGKSVIITNWKEISFSQYEKMIKYFDNQNK